jgi:putative ABC transport system permease protein
MLKLAFKNLQRNIRRTITICLTVAIGAGALFLFQGFIDGVLGDYRESTIHAKSGNGQIHTKGYRNQVFEKPWEHWIGNYDEIADVLEENQEIDDLFPRVSISGMLSHNSLNITGQGQGILADRESGFFDRLRIEEGVSLTTQENGIALGKGLAQSLKCQSGDTVTFYTKDVRGKVRKAKLKVVGVFHTGLAEYDNRAFQIQLPKAQELLRTNLIESIAIGLKDHKNWEKIASNVQEKFPEVDVTSFAEINKIHYQHAVDWLKTQFRIVEVIILSIVILGVFNSISNAILERKKEIGNLRANGESKASIIRLILTEGLLLGLIGGLVGVFFSYLFAKGLLHKKVLLPPGPGFTKQSFLLFDFHYLTAIKTILLNAISAVVATFLAGMKMVRMPITKALR